MAQAHPTLALRPVLPADGPLLAEIFRDSIEELTAEDYSVAQQDAWMSAADDGPAFGARLADQLTLVATLNGSPVGFASLKDPDQIDLIYVHPAVVRQGIASMLVDALERLVGSRGTHRVVVDASDTARPFFEQRGYKAQQRNTVMVGDEWLPNTTMEKQLAAEHGAR